MSATASSTRFETRTGSATIMAPNESSTVIDAPSRAGLPSDSIAQSVSATAPTAARLGNLLLSLLYDVIRLRHPRLVDVVMDDANLFARGRDTTLVLQITGMRLQLLGIAEQVATATARMTAASDHTTHPVPGSVHAFIVDHARRSDGVSSLHQALKTLPTVMPVMTAHPTESKRVTVLQIHRRIHARLSALEQLRQSGHERRKMIAGLRTDIDLLWLTGELRRQRPTVDQESDWNLFFFENVIFDQLPEFYENIERDVAGVVPELVDAVPNFLSFGTWIGGDRDGNPNVTCATTRRTVMKHRTAALACHRRQLVAARDVLSIAGRAVSIDDAFQQRLDTMLDHAGNGADILARNPGEVFRHYLTCLIDKISATAAHVAPSDTGNAASSPNGYRDSVEFADDLALLERALIAADCGDLARWYIRPLWRQAACFGFHFASLDLRVNASAVHACLHEIASLMPSAEAMPPLNDPANNPSWRQWIEAALAGAPGALAVDQNLGADSADLLATFQLPRELNGTIDRRAFGRMIISNTSSTTDILATYLLAKWSGLFEGPAGAETSTLLVVPLFETLDDLQAAPRIMAELLRNAVVRRTAAHHGMLLEAMIGYSDSNKDAGFVGANWAIFKAQRQLAEVGRDDGIDIAFFHGRGGSIGRGGAPTGRAIAAQPPGTTGRRISMTEQGEVVSTHYGDGEACRGHLDILAASIFRHADAMGTPVAGDIEEAMDALASLSVDAYRALVGHPGFVTYFEAASPLRELSLLKLGSRPERRRTDGGLGALRAIPWMFAWSQNRQLVPGWYGLGHAMRAFVRIRGSAGTEMLHRLFNEMPLFRLMVDEAEKALLLVDPVVGAAFARLAPEENDVASVRTMIDTEFRHTEEEILRLTGESELCDRFPEYLVRMNRRFSALRDVGVKQATLIADHRAAAAAGTPPLSKSVPVMLAINSVSAGLGWTG